MAEQIINVSPSDFHKVMELIEGSYNNFGLSENKERSYFMLLSMYTNKELWHGATRHIRNSKYPPTIHDLLVAMKENGVKVTGLNEE